LPPSWWSTFLTPPRAGEEEHPRRREDLVALALIDLTLRSVAQVAIVEAQDVLGLGDEARMNMPGVEGGNWGWRLVPGQLTAEHAARLRALTERTARVTGTALAARA
jgi:4-alpha-glucanotransferase